jgi:CTP synthase
MYIHVTLVPYIRAAGEFKTKPTQHSVSQLRAIGIQPNMLVARSAQPINDELRKKISLFCSVPVKAVISAVDVPSIYAVPIKYMEQDADDIVCRHFGWELPPAEVSDWEVMVEKIVNPKRTIKIGICGKYVNLKDAYKSIIESFVHAGVTSEAKVDLVWVSSEDIKKKGPDQFLYDLDGLLIPGGFGERGVEGKIEAIRYVREHKIPFFGICLGMQCAVIEYARNVCGLSDAHSYEFYRDLKHPVIHLMADQEGVTDLGGTMRLGAYPCVVTNESKTFEAYQDDHISERHRHRYEVNNAYREMLVEQGLTISGVSPDNRLVEIVEISNHPWFIGVQFHPELKSRPTKPHPLFREFVQAAAEYHEQKKTSEVTAHENTVKAEK